jgi:YbbR domain-containing protein
MGESEGEVPAKVKLEIANLPKRLVRTSEIPNEIEIKVRGTRAMLRGVREDQLRYVLDLSAGTVGAGVYKISVGRIQGLPKQVTVTEIVPSQLQIALAERRTRVVRVNPVFRGKLADGLERTGVLVDPETVEISGAKEEVDLLNEVDTEIIELSDRTETFAVEVDVDLVNRHIELAKEQKIRVTVQIGEPRINKVFYGVPIEVRNCPYSYRLSRTDLDVQLEGAQEQLTQLTPGDLRLIIDAEDLAPGNSYEMVPVLRAPEGMGFRNINMAPVRITILDKPKKSGKKKP